MYRAHEGRISTFDGIMGHRAHGDVLFFSEDAVNVVEIILVVVCWYAVGMVGTGCVRHHQLSLIFCVVSFLIFFTSYLRHNI